MQIVNNRLPAATEGAGAPASPTARSGQALEGVRGLARRTARLTASTGLAGSLAIMGLMGAPHPQWNHYFWVPSIAAAKTRIEDNGGQIVNGPQEIPGGEYSVSGIDPQGASFAIVGPRKA